MAGTFKKFVGGIALESHQTTANDGFYHNTDLTIIPFKTIDGVSHNTVGLYLTTNTGGQRYLNSLSPYALLTPVATSDKLEDYSLNDYSVSNAVGTTTCTKARTINNTGATLVYAITVSAGENDITVNCIKFKKGVTLVKNNSTTTDLLVCGYYLETPLTITAGTSQTINVAFTVGEMSAVS